MSRILGIDFGTKRVGLAVSDESGKLAVPLKIVPAKRSTLIQEFGDAIKEFQPQKIVVGYPRSLRTNEITVMAQKAQKFADWLSARFEINVVLADEKLSSVLARRLGSKRGKIDDQAAAVILQSYLDKHN